MWVSRFGTDSNTHPSVDATISSELCQRPARIAVLTGEPGMGKTILALKFAKNHKETFPNQFWIDGSSITSIEESYKTLAKYFGHEKDIQTTSWERQSGKGSHKNLSEISKIVNEHLESKDNEGQWLLIIDRADEPKYDIFPKEGGAILYTSNNSYGWLPTQKISLKTFTSDEALDLAKTYFPEESDEDLMGLIKSRKCKPDALHFALLDIQDRKRDKDNPCIYTVAQYLQETIPLSWIDITILGIKYETAASWVLSLNYLQEKNALAVQWVQVCSYLSSDLPIPKEFLKIWLNEIKKEQDPGKIERIIHELHGRHFIDYDSKNETFTIDDQLQLFVKSQIKESREEFLSQACTLLEKVEKHTGDKWEELILQHSKAVNPLSKSCMEKVKGFARDIKKACSNFKFSSVYAQAYYSEIIFSPRAWKLFKIAESARKLSHYHDAIEYYSEVIKIERAIHNEENSPGLCAALIGLGHAYRGLGELDLAHASYSRVVSIVPIGALAVPGSLSSAQTLIGLGAQALIGLGHAYKEQESFDEAIAHYMKALEIEKKQSGYENPMTLLVIYRGLQRCYLGSNPSLASIYEEKALQMEQKVEDLD